MEIIGGVTAVPFGLLACRIDGREVQITEIGENGFAFRTAEPIAMEKNEDHRIEVSFYHMVQGQYETVRSEVSKDLRSSHWNGKKDGTAYIR